MRTTRRAFQGVAAVGLLATATGCATVRETVVGALLGQAGGGREAVVASTYESLPRQYLWRPPVLGLEELRRFKGWGGDCGLVFKPTWVQDVIVLPAPGAGPLVDSPRQPLVGVRGSGSPLPAATGVHPLDGDPLGVWQSSTVAGLLPAQHLFPMNKLPFMRLAYLPCRSDAGRRTSEAG
jgi:hypothetical protein